MSIMVLHRYSLPSINGLARKKLPIAVKRRERLRSSLAIFCALISSFAAAADRAKSPRREDHQNARCLPGGEGYLRARLAGAITTEFDWSNRGTECTGSIRPNGGGLRLRFRHSDARDGSTWVIVFGITGLKEGESGKALPVNLTLIREGGELFATQGDGKCTIDDVKQEILGGPPSRKRAYRVVARGFCTQPARALKGAGSILMTRFDYAGRVDFDSEGDAPAAPT